MMNKKQLPAYLLLVILFCLVVPVLQSTTHVLPEKPLDGFMTTTMEMNFSKEAWFSGEYQTQKEKNKNETFGLRDWSIRFHNQVAYSFFGKTLAKDVVIGKDTYLYEKSYISAYYGQDFIGDDKIKERMEKLKFICESFNKLNKTIIVVFAPGKGFYYPEYIPDEYKAKRSTTNIERYIHYAKTLGINYIDFNQYFMDNKKKYNYLLYPKHGVHWSMYGSDIAADSIVRYVERVRGIDMPNLYWKDSETVYGPDTENDVDYDIAKGMNLLFKFPADQMRYPNVQCEPYDGKTRPSVIVVGDSFYWGMKGYIQNSFADNSQFWYYNKSIFYQKEGTASTEMVNIKQEIDQHDVYILLATPGNLANFPWSFIDNTYKMLTKETVDFETYKKKVEDFRNFIKSDKNWLEDSRKRAIEKNISLDSSITLDALYQVRLSIESE
ncbi:MAG: hypothetical protein JWM14_2760 [Chitinophagaceae bacterium]|nr:hypothetical protein [Chitinophagaceae bacterium]